MQRGALSRRRAEPRADLREPICGGRACSQPADADRRVALVIAALLLLLAAVMASTRQLQLTSTYGVGPKAMPIVVAGGLALLAIGNVIMALRGDLPSARAPIPRRSC